MRSRFDSILKIEKNILDSYIKDANLLKEKINKLQDEKTIIEDGYKVTLKNKDYDFVNLFYGRYYSDLIRKQISEKNEKIFQLQKKLDKQQDLIAEKFTDVKRIELIIKRKKIEHQNKLNKKEQNFLDEIKIDKI